MAVPQILKQITRQVLDFQKAYSISLKVVLIVTCPPLLLVLVLYTVVLTPLLQPAESLLMTCIFERLNMNNKS